MYHTLSLAELNPSTPVHANTVDIEKLTRRQPYIVWI